MAKKPSLSEVTSKARAELVDVRRMLITGLIILTPVALTAYILIVLFNFMDGMFSPLLRRILGVHIPGLGILLTLLLVLLLGWLSTNVLGRRLLVGLEGLISNLPVAKSIYSATKGIVDALAQDQREAFKRVVLIEYPKENLFALAFVTSGAQWPTVHPKTTDMHLVFVPTTPNPTSGFLLLVPKSEAIELPITVEEGIRMILSGGILLPTMPAAPRPPLAGAAAGGAAAAAPAPGRTARR